MRCGCWMVDGSRLRRWPGDGAGGAGCGVEVFEGEAAVWEGDQRVSGDSVQAGGHGDAVGCGVVVDDASGADEGPGQKVTMEASMAKLYAGEAACRICDEGVQIHGGYGFIKDYPAEKFYRDVKLCTIGEGTSEIQRIVIARELLKRQLAGS